MGERLNHWKEIADALPKTREGQALGALFILDEVMQEARQKEREEEEQRRRAQAIRFVHRAKLPEGVAPNTFLGLLCERSNTVIPIGHLAMHPGSPEGWVYVCERGESMGCLEMHHRTCTCTLQCMKMSDDWMGTR